MPSFSKTLTEDLKSSAVIPRRLQNADLSTKSKVETFYGTYQQVINALDEKGIPEHKVIGFALVSPGNCVALVHRH